MLTSDNQHQFYSYQFHLSNRSKVKIFFISIELKIGDPTLHYLSTMSTNNELWQECQNLNHHSLEAFLISIIERPNVYNLYQFLQHPQISTVDEMVLKLYKLFVNQTFITFPQNLKAQLSALKLQKLKKLTILKLFEGLTQISLKKICSSISATEDQAIDLLIEMSIASTIDIKINQKLSKVQIHYSEVLGRQFTHEETVILESKISHIISKNNRVLNTIDEAIKEIANKKQDMKRHY